jgi:hypothetical protein
MVHRYTTAHSGHPSPSVEIQSRRFREDVDEESCGSDNRDHVSSKNVNCGQLYNKR